MPATGDGWTVLGTICGQRFRLVRAPGGLRVVVLQRR
jgi:hypothetical protein